MRQTLEFRYNDTNDTIEVLYKGCKELDDYINFHTTPKSRVWSKDTNCWVITPDVIGKVVAIGSSHFDEVKYFSLPPRLQEEVKKFISTKKGYTIKPQEKSEVSNYSKLFLIDGAPKFLVRAVYKSLAMYYHPDNKETGNHEKFIEIADAYNTLKD